MIFAPQQPLRYEGELSRSYGLPMYEKVDIQKMIQDAYDAGEKEITIPRGAYRIWPQETGGHINLFGMKDFTINAYGVTFVYQSTRKSGLVIKNSDNLTIRGLSSDFEPLIFMQYRVTKIAPDRSWLEFEMDRGYGRITQEDIDKKWSIEGPVYDGVTGRFVEGSIKMVIYLAYAEMIDDYHFRYNLPLDRQFDFLKEGDYVCPINVANRPGAGVNTSITESGAMHFEDYTCYSSPISCICETFSDGGSTFKNLKIMPGPKPYAADHKRLLSMSGDGFHSTHVRKGASFEDSYWEGLADDGINIHGLYAVIEKRVDAHTIIIGNHDKRQGYRVGDKLRFYNEKLELTETVTVKSAKKLPDYVSDNPIAIRLAAAVFHIADYAMVEVEESVTSERGDWVVNANCNSSGFSIRNCTFFNLTPRGVLIKGSDGIVENCFFDTCMHCGIRVTPEHEWIESDYSHNVIIRNCHIRRCGGRSGYTGYGISVNGHEAIEQRNIIIENCIFEDNYNRDLHITCGQDIIVRNNVFGKVNATNTCRGQEYNPCVKVNWSKRVTFENNTYPEGRHAGVIGAEVEDIVTDVPYTAGSWSDECIWGEQGRGGWEWQYSPIGTNEYLNYHWIGGKGAKNAWWAGEFEDFTHGCVSRLWWDTYMYPGTESDAVKTYTCPRDGKVAIGTKEPIKAGDFFDKTDGVLVKILKNDETIFPEDGGWQAVPLFKQLDNDIITCEVKAGDKLHFRVNQNQISCGNGTSWAPFVFYVD